MKYGPRQTWVFSPSASRTNVNQGKLGARNAGQSSTAQQIAHWPHTYPLQGRSNTEPLAQNAREPPPYVKSLIQRAADSPRIATGTMCARNARKTTQRPSAPIWPNHPRSDSVAPTRSTGTCPSRIYKNADYYHMMCIFILMKFLEHIAICCMAL